MCENLQELCASVKIAFELAGPQKLRELTYAQALLEEVHGFPQQIAPQIALQMNTLKFMLMNTLKFMLFFLGKATFSLSFKS